jgi:hypothetical protein
MTRIQMKTIQEVSQNQSYIPFTFRELIAIEVIIDGYTRYVTSFPPSPEKEKRLEILDSVQQRLDTQLCILQQGRSIQLILAPEELAELLAAMEGFIERSRSSFPQNSQQAQVICAVNSWRLRLIESVLELQA